MHQAELNVQLASVTVVHAYHYGDVSDLILDEGAPQFGVHLRACPYEGDVRVWLVEVELIQGYALVLLLEAKVVDFVTKLTGEGEEREPACDERLGGFGRD